VIKRDYRTVRKTRKPKKRSRSKVTKHFFDISLPPGGANFKPVWTKPTLFEDLTEVDLPTKIDANKAMIFRADKYENTLTNKSLDNMQRYARMFAYRQVVGVRSGGYGPINHSRALLRLPGMWFVGTLRNGILNNYSYSWVGGNAREKLPNELVEYK